MGGVIKLGQSGAMRNYSLRQTGEGLAWERGPANPFAAKVNTSNQYDSVDSWNEWVQEDWQAGVGEVNPEAGGFLYGEVDSRVPNQLVLPQALDIYAPVRSLTASAYTAWTLAPGQFDNTYTRATRTLAQGEYFAWKIQGDAPDATTHLFDVVAVWVYAEAENGAVLRADIYSDSSGPNASLANASLAISNDFPGPQWHRVEVSLADANIDTARWVVVRPTTGSITLYGLSNVANFSARSSSDGSSWSSVTTFQPFYKVQGRYDPAGDEDAAYRITAMHYTTNANGAVMGRRDGEVYQPATDGPYLALVGSAASPIVHSLAIFDDKLFVSTDDISYTLPLDLSSSTGTEEGPSAHLALNYGGHLWTLTESGTVGVRGRGIQYSNDPFDRDSQYSLLSEYWVTPSEAVCPEPYNVNSMAGLGNELYMACDDGLYVVALGDRVTGVLPWEPDPDNGRSMCSFEGALYIVVHGRVWRYGLDGSWRDVWVDRDDDLPSRRLGEVVYVATTDIGVVALVNSEDGRSSVWAYQDQGWHHLMTLPTDQGSAMYHDRQKNKLWVGTDDGYLLGIYMPNNALNPYNDEASTYMPAAWIEQDRFRGRQYLLDKLGYSVTVIGDNISSTTPVKVYWQDEDSTNWELLGTATSDGHQLKWPKATRPMGRWIRLAAMLSTSDADETPRVRALVLKYLTEVHDRRRDSMTLVLHDYTPMPDDTPDEYTLTEQIEHIEQLIGLQDSSDDFILMYEDPFGSEFEVTIADFRLSIPRYAHLDGENEVLEVDAQLVLEQVDASA